MAKQRRSGGGKGQGKAAARSKEDRERSREQRRAEIQRLQERIAAEAPARGYTPPLTQLVAFRALPLSDATLQGLDGASYTTMTAIQNACIPHALAGRDILGAARTGSGKTLAYLIPVLEILYRHYFSPVDGPGAIVLSPTRELAVQIFSVLKKVGKYHTFSVGLLIGGKKDFYDEQQHIATTNLIIATPGRLLQHCEQTPYLDQSSVKILVLDEADRILDMGFRDQLLRILDYLPPSTTTTNDDNDTYNEMRRQTLLFSATQTKDVSHLATLSLKKPEYLGVHDKEKNSTPEGLVQSYVVVPLKDKLNAVFSFLKSNLKTKSILFFASCAQVRHAYELLCSLRPGIPVLALHGKLPQTKRTQVYFDFLQRPHAVLVATDVCARGLDFPNVDWVVQADAPEDREMYIHRAGRTARYRSGGKALLMLTPQEEANGFLDMLQRKNTKRKEQSASVNNSDSSNAVIPLKKLSINPSKAVVVGQRAASLVAADVELHRLAKKAFQSYVRSIHLMPHKDVFQVKDLDLDGYAASLGLALTPNLQFIKKVGDRDDNRQSKNVNRKLQKLKEQIKADKLAKKIARLGANAAETEKSGNQAAKGDDDDDELLVSKKRHNMDECEKESENEDEHIDPKLNVASQSRHPKKIRIDASNSVANTRIIFDDDGQEQNVKALLDVDQELVEEIVRQDKQNLARAADDYMQKVRQRLQATSARDEEDAKQRVREKHRKRRLQDKSDKIDAEAGGAALLLGEGDGDSKSQSESSASEDQDSKREMADDDGTYSSASEDSEDDGVMAAQEEMALALIRGSS